MTTHVKLLEVHQERLPKAPNFQVNWHMTRCLFMTDFNSLCNISIYFLELAACLHQIFWVLPRIAARSPSSWSMSARSKHLLGPLLYSVGMLVLLPGEMRNMADRAQCLGDFQRLFFCFASCFVEGCCHLR